MSADASNTYLYSNLGSVLRLAVIVLTAPPPTPVVHHRLHEAVGAEEGHQRAVPGPVSAHPADALQTAQVGRSRRQGIRRRLRSVSTPFCITGWPIVDNQLNDILGNRHLTLPFGGVHK